MSMEIAKEKGAYTT